MEAKTKPASTPNPKARKLVELASTRVPKALKALNLVGNLAAYKPTEAQKKAILDALDNALKNVRTRFATGEPEAPKFELPS